MTNGPWFSRYHMAETDFNRIIALICKEDPRFDRSAYFFVRDGLDYSVKELKKRDAARARQSKHVTGRELSAGLKDYALEQFGPMAMTVLEAWGVRETIHFGDIVYNLIDYGAFSKTENDRREDFADVFSFQDAFVAPFLPRTPRAPAALLSEGE